MSGSFKRVQASVMLDTAEALAFVSERTGKSVSELAGLCIDVGMLDRDGLPDYLDYCGYDLDEFKEG